jgi:hypothetical protein
MAVPFFLYGQPKPVSESDTLQNVTTLRPADPVLNTAGWSFSSVDMFTYNFSNGLYGNYGIKPEIKIDGIPADINFFGWQNLNMLPIYMPNLERVSDESSTFFNNELFSVGGVINFQNKKIKQGLNVGGNIYLGNETGDPGPWVYDSTRVTPNVDRWGPDAGGVLSYGKNNWYGKGVFMLRRHQQTDPISNRRIQTTMRQLGSTRFNLILTNSQSGLFEGGYLSDSWKLKIRGILAEDRNYIFLQPFGREVPAQTEYRQWAIDAKHISDNWKFNLSYTLNQKEINRRNSEHGFIFDWNEIDNNYTGSIAYNAGQLELAGKIKVDIKNVEAPGLLRQNYPISGLHLDADWLNNDENIRSKISAGLDIHQGETAPKLAASYSKELSNHWKLSLETLYNEVLPIRRQSFGYWITQGYNFYEELGIIIDQPLAITKDRLQILGLRNIIDVSEKFSVTFSSQLTKHFDINVPWHKVNYNPETGTTPGTFTITEEEGTRLSFEGELNQSLLTWLDHSFTFHYQKTLEGSQQYNQYFRQVPVAQLRYRLLINPAKNLQLTFQGYYRSSSRWLEFENLDGQEYRDIDNLFPIFSGTYDSTVPEHLDIELGAQKWFWGKRMSLQFTVKNLLNDEIRIHPMGADQSLMFNIKAIAGF